jgi:hypothetical protein
MNELGADTNLPQPHMLTTMRVCCPDLALKLAQILVEVRSVNPESKLSLLQRSHEQ